MTTDLLVKPDAKGELVDYDPREQEPEFEVYLKTVRVDDKGRSEWRAAHVIEGVPHGDLSQTQRQWMAAVLHHLSISLEGNLVLTGKTEPERMHDLLQWRRQQMKALTNVIHADIQGVVESQGVEFAARALGMKPYQVRHMLKSKRLELET